jgi:hypothetical protein
MHPVQLHSGSDSKAHLIVIPHPVVCGRVGCVRRRGSRTVRYLQLRIYVRDARYGPLTSHRASRPPTPILRRPLSLSCYMYGREGRIRACGAAGNRTPTRKRTALEHVSDRTAGVATRCRRRLCVPCPCIGLRDAAFTSPLSPRHGRAVWTGTGARAGPLARPCGPRGEGCRRRSHGARLADTLGGDGRAGCAAGLTPRSAWSPRARRRLRRRSQAGAAWRVPSGPGALRGSAPACR